ncbi:MAG TPA: hypothetical protein DHV29_04605 [Bacteroidales bacterium]|nr:hypothetical protein [Bacteroidales bacterium]
MVLVVVFGLNGIGQVTIMPGSVSIDACNNFPVSGTVTNIVLTETNTADLTDGTHTIILAAPANYIFTSPGTVSYTGLNISSASIVLSSSTTLTITINVSGGNKINTVTIAGIVVQSSSVSIGDITRNGGTGVSSILNGAVFATLSTTSTSAPTLTAPTNGSSLTCNATSTTLSWSAGGCSPLWDVYLGTTNPPATLVSNDQAATTYNASGLTLGTTYYWKVVPASGSLNASTVNSFTTVQPTAPVAPDVIRCDPGTVTLGASGGSSSNYFWYDAATGGTCLGTGNTYTTPSISTTTPYYVESVSLSSETSLNSGLTVVTGALSANSFAAYNITNLSSDPLIVTQISIRVNEGSVSRNFQVYYRTGTFSGNEAIPGNWTQAGGTYTVTTAAIGTPTIIDVDDFTIPAGQLTGIYIYTTSQVIYCTGTSTANDGTLSMSGGSVQGGLLSPLSAAGVNGYGIIGAVYYQKKSCISSRTEVDAIINGFVTPGGTIAADPGSTIAPCQNVSFTCVPINGGTSPEYQWKLNGVDIANADASTYSTMTLNSGDQISCVVTSDFMCASPATGSSNVITMTVSGSGATIATSPTDAQACQNGSAIFTATTSPAGGPYQWMVSSDGGTTWEPITDAGSEPTYSGWNTGTLGLTGIGASNNGFLYKCMTECNSSASAILNVTPTGYPSVTDGGSCSTPATITLGASGAAAGESYHWYTAATGGAPAATGSSYAPTVGTTTTFYVATFNTTTLCESYPRTPIVAEIYSAPVVTSQPTDETVAEGSGTSFSVSANGATGFQWQVSTDNGSTWTNIAAAGSSPTYSGWTTSSLSLFSVPVSCNLYQYRCIVDGHCTYETNSNGAILSVSTLPLIYLHPTVGLQSTYVGACMTATCNASYYDDGGAANPYSNNVNQVFRTFCPNTPLKAVRATISMIDVEYAAGPVCSDVLYVQNGPGQGSPNMWYGCGSSPAPVYTAGGAWNGGVFTSTHVSGCLTFRFSSGASSVGPWDGWQINLTCVDFPTGPSGETNTDCVNSTPVCSDVTASSFTYGPGLTSDNCEGCITSEYFTEWYYVHIATSGTVEMEIVPNGVSDLDFAFFKANNCGSLGTPIRCSYAARTSPGKTGMEQAPGTTDFSEDVAGDQWVEEVNVVAGEYYYLMVNEWDKPNPNQYTIDWTLTNGASFDCDITEPLPVSMIGFYAEKVFDGSELTWITATENNNDYFTVERSLDGIEFEAIGIVDGAGNSNVVRTYQFSDYGPLSGVVYYRIKQTDFNGEFEYSDIVAVDFATDEEPLIVELFPNPADDYMTVRASRYFVNKPYKVFNLMGMIIMEGTLDGVMPRIYFDNLQDGLYLLNIEGLESQRFTILNK